MEKKIRPTLADEERIRIDKHLKENYYPFWRFVQIFFPSGGRIVELLGAKCCHVNLEKQIYKVTIRKEPEIKNTVKIIKDIALPLWKELLENSNPDDYIFSVGLLPGKSKIRREQLPRRWNVHIKKKLGIEADLYSLKHLNTTEIVEALSDEDAAKLDSHTSTEMVNTIYDVRWKNHESRTHFAISY